MRRRRATEEQAHGTTHAATPDQWDGFLAAQPSQCSADSAAVGATVEENQRRKSEERHEAKVEAEQEREDEKTEDRVAEEAKDSAHGHVGAQPTMVSLLCYRLHVPFLVMAQRRHDC